MGDEGGAFRILVVCSANVCRSPVAAALIASHLDATVPGLTHVVSRGVWAEDGQPACALAIEQAGLPRLEHVSARMTPADIAAADLILTAEQAHRAAVVERDLGARRRTFTLREAAALGSWVAAGAPVPEGLELPPPPAAPADPALRLRWWASELNAGRGLASLGADREWDIPDAHGISGVEHGVVVAEVQVAALAALTGALA